MRHKILRNKLSRNSEQREALIKNSIRSFFKNNGSLSGPLVRAKVLRVYIEKVISKARRSALSTADKLSVIRYLHAYLGDKTLVDKVMECGEVYKDRPGGYTRISRAGYRAGDNACRAYITLVDNVLDVKFTTPVATEEEKEEIAVQKRLAFQNARDKRRKEAQKRKIMESRKRRSLKNRKKRIA